MVGNDTIHTVTRKEHDCIGYMDVPKDVYWGIHTQRALGNFTVSRIADSTHPQLMRAYATVKRACAEANDELGLIDHDKARLIVAACHDVENGELADQFPVDVLQGGAGTSTNMNMNEVIANRALELGGHPKGDYGFIHPNDDVKPIRNRPTTPTPAACKLALIDAIGPLAEETKKLTRAFHDLADKHTNDVTIGRTQLQDAVPMTYGQEFHAFASFLKSDLLALEHVVPQLTTLNLGATAIGTGICADLRFRTTATRHLAAITGLPITAASDPVAAMTDMSGYIATSQTVKNLAIHLQKGRRRPATAQFRPAYRIRRPQRAGTAGGQQHHARQGEPGHPRMREPMLLHGVRHGHDRHMGRIRRAIAAQRLRPGDHPRTAQRHRAADPARWRCSASAACPASPSTPRRGAATPNTPRRSPPH